MIKRQRWMKNSICERYYNQYCADYSEMCDYHVSYNKYLDKKSLTKEELEAEIKDNIYWTFKKILVIRLKLCPCFHCCVERDKEIEFSKIKKDIFDKDPLRCPCPHCDYQRKKKFKWSLNLAGQFYDAEVKNLLKTKKITQSNFEWLMKDKMRYINEQYSQQDDREKLKNPEAFIIPNAIETWKKEK